MAGEEPPYLTVGTDVSAKYKGAFCEAKIKKVTRSVKCKLTFKNNVGTAIVTDDQIRGTLRVGAHVEARHPEKNQFLEAVINKLNDYSQYTVVFDDGDETTLRRTSLCLKSGRHFAESETLDQLPLTHPEHFGNPVMNSKGRRSRTTTRSPAVDESSDDEQASKKKEVKAKPTDPDIGRVICVEQTDKKKSNKDSWFPALIISSKCQDTYRVKKQEEFLVRSFRDGKYHIVSKKDAKDFVREQANKVEHNTLKTAVEKVLTYLDKDELPNHWDRDVLFGLEDSCNEESDQATESDTSDDEPSEEKDRFVAQLYKFMDDRGTSINKAPTVCNRDLNLYKLFKVVQKSGGYNRVTNQMQWKTVYAKMGFPPGNSSSSHQIKQAYKKYLHSFEEFYRKLGISMGSNTRSGRVRYRSGRYLLLARDQHFKGTRRRTSKSEIKSVSNDAEKSKSREEDDHNVTDSEEAKSEKQDKDQEESSDSKKSEENLQDSKVKTEKDDESDKESKADGEDSENETSKPAKEESKIKSKSKNPKDDEIPPPKRRGRKKVEKTPPNADDGESSNNNDDEEEDFRDSLDIAVGDRIKVKYGRGRQQKIYEAKVLKLGEDENEKEFFVHYTGWNMRYDEWVKRHRIVKNLSQKGTGRRPRSTTPAKSPKTPAKKGRPQGSVAGKKEAPERKSSTPTSTSRGRVTRGDKSVSDSPNDQKRMTRHSSLQRDASDESDSDYVENQQKRTKRSLTKKNSQTDDSEAPLTSKTEEEETEDLSDIAGKKAALKSENVKKDSGGSSKDKSDKLDEEDTKKSVKKSKEKPKNEDNSDLLEESPKSTRRPRGRPPRQIGEEKKSSSITCEKKSLFRNESESRDDNDNAADETETNSIDLAIENTILKEDNSDSVAAESVKSDEDATADKDCEKEENSDADVAISANEDTTVSSKIDEVMEPEEDTPTVSEEVNESLKDDEKISNKREGLQVDNASDTPLLVEPESVLLCTEKMLEEESTIETITPAVIPETADVPEENIIQPVAEENMDIDTNSPVAPIAEELEKSKVVINETKVTEVEQESVLNDITLAVITDKPDQTADEIILGVSEQKVSKKELQSDCTSTETCEKPTVEESAIAEGSKVDEYDEECTEEKLDLKENSLKKIEKVSAIEAVETPHLVETSDVSTDSCTETVKEVAKAMKIENKVDEIIQPAPVVVNHVVDPVVEPALEIKSEKCEFKLESSPGPAVLHISSKSVKKEKKKKTHKAEKRKLLADGDSSDDGSSIDEPKVKKRKNRDDESGVKKESKGKEPKQKKSREKRNKSKGERDEIKLLKKSGGAEKSRKKECKKKKESPEKNRKDRDEELKQVIDSDDLSSVSSDSCQRKEKKRSRKHQRRCEKNRDEFDKKRLKKYKTGHDDDTSDENNRGKKARREEKSKNKKKRDKGKSKDFHITSEDSNSSKMSGSLGKFKEKSVEKSIKSDDGECEIPKYLMCEEKVPASPVGASDIPDGTAGIEDRPDLVDLIKGKENVRSKINDGASSSGTVSPNRRLMKLDVNDSSTILDHTPPTTPESSGTAILDHLHDHSSPSSLSLNDADSNHHATTGKSSQGSSPQNYSDETERCRDLLIDESNNHVELVTGSDEGERDELKSVSVFGSSSVKRPCPENDDHITTKKKKKRHRKHLSVNETNKQNTSLDTSGNRHSSKHIKATDTEEVPSSTTDMSVTASGLLLGRLNPTGGMTDTSLLPNPSRPSRYNFYVHLDDYPDADQRIAAIQDKLGELKKTYLSLKSEVASIDRRRKKLKKKEKEVASTSTSVASTIVECN
ncbi:hypothetical protein CHUAL_010202 [Chamberlinius hualienensis]